MISVNQLAFQVIKEMNGISHAYDSTFSDAFAYVVFVNGYNKEDSEAIKDEVISKVKSVLV